MASHLFSRPSSAKFVLRNRLRRVLLESLERRELMAADILGFSDLGAPVSYSLGGQASQPLAFHSNGDLSGMSPDEVTSYLDSTLGANSGDLTSRAWFPLIQESYSKWSQQNGLAFSYTSGLIGEGEGEGDGLIAEGEAGGPRLLSIAPNSGNIFSFNNVNTLTEAPTELVFRFDGSASGIRQSTIAGGIKLVRANRDGIFGNGNDQIITPGYLSFGDNNKIVVMRFATTLPDDLYRVMVIGTDNATLSPPETAIRADDNKTLDVRTVDSTSLDLTRDSVDFRVELGAQVVAVVPQPIDRLASNTVNLVQSGASLVLRAHQGETTDNAAGNSVSLRLVQFGAVNDAAYDKATNRITVSLVAGATVNDIATAINTKLSANFSVQTGSVVGGANVVNALDLGIRTVSLTNWALDPKRDQIRVYFNEDDLFPTSVKTGDLAVNPTVVDPAFYQLILTSDTVQPGDDQIFSAQSISYDPLLNLATLTFTQPIDQLAGAGTYRLRIGGRDSVANVADPKTIVPVNVVADQADSLSGANTGTFLPVTLNTSTSIILNQSIITTSTTVLPLDYPGSNFEPGHRDVQDETHINQTAGDASPQIARQFYNFALNRPYGLDAAGRPVSTTITPEQLARVREIFEFYSMMLGIDFVESESEGLTFVVGDLFPAGGAQSGPGGVIGIAGGGLAILDGAEVWDNSFGGQSGIPGSQNFFLVAMHELGHLLGYGHTSELPVLTVMAGSALPFTEWSFPGDHDVVHGQYMFRPDNRDVDTYKFIVPAGKSGTFSAETIAERLPDSSNLDTYLALLKETAKGYEIVAVNNDSFSSDSFLSVKLTEGNYFLSVMGKGNENFNPLIANTGDGAVSQGNYQLKVDFKEDVGAASIIDPAGSALDGDGDGLAGGNFNFWFRTAAPVGVAAPGAPKTIYVDKGFAGAQTGSSAAPMNSLDFNNSVRWPVGFIQPGDIVRVVGSLGSDRLLSTSLDNPAYEIGRGGVGNAPLSDGLALEVPQGVTLMVDAGAIFKLGNSRLAAGSLDASINRSFSSLQVLGTPRQTVNFTSYNDQSQGTDTNPLATSPQAGDWGGIDLRNTVDRQEGRGDYERKGIFLNYLSHADIRYGGGQITVVSPSPTINPINLSEARPTLLYNTIRFSADAAIAADPNSFEETRFTEPRYQLAQSFLPDYDRVGPDLRGNIVTNNTVNGLFVRTSTAAGGALTTLETIARWDDTDITFVLGENLIISGTPGGSFLENRAPDMSLVQTPNATGGTLVPGQSVLYKVTAVDRNGAEGVPSAATPSKTLATNAVLLTNLPTAAGDFVSRRLWRSTDNGATYRLVAELDGDTTSYTDIGADLSAVLANPNAIEIQRARPDARLQIDPGVVVKMTGARIEVGISAQLIAEGSADRKVVFTSRSDDRFGAGGTFDTNSNLLASNPSAGDWGGLVARHLSSISIDQANIFYGGGQTSVSGGFAGFNAVEIHQAEARVTNSVLENNASGLGGNSGATRDGRGPHDASVIYVVGSQPVIAENIIRNNAVNNTAVISVNANAMKTNNVQDRGRQTGKADLISAGLGNSGPLVDGNLLASNGLNGMRIRGQILTTATVWDDTDIVHILQSEVVVPDLHTYGGMRLQSKSDESLVVKLGPAAGLTATGQPLDIVDRIGGSLQIIGAPGFPVVLTSLSDDTVGAGFDPTGRPLVDTNNNGVSTGTAGSWRSVRLDPYANDRNLDTTFEYEADQIQESGTNDVPTAAQSLGGLAPAMNGGDENLRLGFTIHGAIASPRDTDVYTFTGTAGTPVWIDIDQTNGALDTVVELIDSAGNILAQSNNSIQESANASLLFVTSDATKITPDKVQPLDQSPFAPRNSFQNTIARDLYSVNPLDAGLRVVLPGATGGANTYYVRVRSSNLKPGDAAANLQDPAKLRDGLTTGSYRLQLRMQQNDETAGSTVRFADIRFATNGIEANGMPAHSPLLGQIGEQGAAGGNDAADLLASGAIIANLPGLGNIVSSDRGSMSVAGSINGVTDVDLYSFSVSRNLTQSGGAHISTILDVDYADGIGRPDTTLWVYQVVNNNPVLVLVGTDSSIADDRSAPEQGADLDALSRGSVGARDPFIGAAELPNGNYVVAVSNNSRMAAAMQQYQTATPINALIRLEPVNSVNRLFVDRIGGSSADTATAAPVLFTTIANNGGISANNSVPWTLADVTTYIVRNNGNGSQLAFANAMTGVQEAEISNFIRVNDTAMSPDGRLVGYEIPTTVAITDASSGAFHLINSIGAAGGAATPNNASTNSGNHGIQTFTTQQTSTATPPAFAIQQRDQNGLAGGNTPQGDGIQINGLTMYTATDSSTTLFMFGVGSRANNQDSFAMPTFDANNAVNGTSGQFNFNTRNIVYKLNPDNGAAVNPDNVADRTGNGLVNGAGTQKVEFGRFLSGTAANNYTEGTVTGLAEVGGVLFAVSNLGELFSASVGTGGNAFAPNTFVNTATVTYSGRTSITTINNPATGTPILFTGLTAGPRNLEGGRFANMLFGTTADGTIWAFDTAGVLQPIFPGFSPSIKSSASPLNTTGSVSGIEFSPLDVNLWHQTNTRGGDAGHGRTVPFDSSQDAVLQGGNSLYFGFEDGTRAANNRQQGTWQGVYNVAGYQGNYNLPGGARGAIVSNAMDLSGYSADDLPMLYFNYFLASEDANSDLDDSDIRMRDAFRVYGAGEDGNWILLTTNNSDVAGGNRNSALDEFDTDINQNFDPYGNPLYTQETFDNTGAWRQARTSLSAFAGQENVRLRFEFSTGASFRTGNAQLGGVELTAVIGAKLNDGESFTITPVDGVSPLGPQTFELDMGLVLDLPGGASITDGVSKLVVSGITITFSLSDNAGDNIQYLATDSPAQIAAKVRSRLPAILGLPAANITVNSLRSNILNIAGLTGVNTPLIAEIEPNSTLATAQNVDAGPWSLQPNANIDLSTSRPHLTISGTGDVTFDYYSFTANAGDVGVFDTDFTNFDTELFLYDSLGNLIAGNDDSTEDPGATGLDSFIRHTFTAAGTYFIGVGKFNSVGSPGGITGNTPAVGDVYQLHISIDGKPAAPATFGVVSLPSTVMTGFPGVGAGNVAVPINQSMTELQVRDAIRAQLAATFNATAVAATANATALQAWPVHSSSLRIFKYNVTNSSGLGLTANRSGDQFGVQGSNGNRMDERAQNNAFEGVYIDDIIVGFAERGEMVFNSTAADALPAFVANQDYSGLGSTFGIAQIESGPYQLTVRTAAEYGIQEGTRIVLGRSFDTNARLAEQVGIRVANTGSGGIPDGTTFTISDGFNQLAFEFDVTVGAGDIATGVGAGNIRVPITANATPTQIATAIRDAINSSTAQLRLKLTASLQGEMTYGSVYGDVAPSGSALVLLHGDAAALRNGSLTFANTSLLTFVRSGTESPMFSPFGLNFGEDLGDVERQREQGQILLVSNTITNSSAFGILNDAGARNQSAIGTGVGSRPYPGSPIQTPTQNQSNLAPGVVIMNNILANNTSGGVRVSGDGIGTGMAVPSLIARVINNTIYGGADGILVDEGASPTILNNIIANTTNGIRSVGATVVLGANLFQNNTTNTVGTGGDGSFAELLNPGDALFVPSTIVNRRFYLAAGSKAIDSSLEALQERPALTQVKNSIGLPLSPMLAPDVDVTGQRRVDDPTVNSPAGLGGNVFKDRGAVDRSDFIGLNAVILQPQDNDSGLKDSDRNTTFIQLSEGELEFFSLLLQDTNGTGPDEVTVNAAGAVSLTENGRLLIPNVDYVFGYNANSRTIRLTPIAGIWRKDSVYEISLNNRAGIRLTVSAGVVDGNRYTVVRPGGTTVFEFDTGSPAGVSAGAVRVPIQAGFTPYQMAAQLTAAINGVGLGLSSYLQGDGTLMVNGATSITATGAALGTPLAVGAIRDLAGNPLFPNRANSLTQFTIIMPEVKVDFGDIDGANIPTIKLPNSVVAPVVSNGDGARHALLPIDVPLLVLGDFADADTDGAPSASASGDDSETLFSLGTLAAAGATLTNKGSATLSVDRALITDGQQFTITDSIAHPLSSVVFEFNTDVTPSGPTVVPILVAAGDSSQVVAAKIAGAVDAVLKAGRLDNIISVVDPAASNQVRLVANDGYVFNISAAPALTRLAVGNVDIVLPSSIATLDGAQFSFTDGNGRTVNYELNLFDPALAIPPVTANFVAINIPSSVTTPTTPAAVATAIASAINSQLDMRNLLRSLATATGATVSIITDDEDGITFNGVLNSASNPITVTARSSGAGMLDAWMDWNGDGDFSDAGEQFLINRPVQAGANNFTLTTPVNAVPGFVTARFRLSTLGSTLAGGVAIGGEVEDYLVEIVAGNPPVAVADFYATNEDTVLTVTNSLIGNLAVAAAAGQNQVTLTAVTGLAVGHQVLIQEGLNSEFRTVTAISGNIVTLNSNLVRAYSVAATVSAVGVLANDTDADNDPLAVPPILEPRFVFDENPSTAAIDPVVNVSNGTLLLNIDGTFTYTPNLDFNGTDRFVYNVVDTRLKSNSPVTVTIRVNAINDAPLARNDFIGQAQGAFEDATVMVPGALLTVNDLAHFAIDTSPNASNEAGQVLRLKDSGATILSSTTTSFGNIAGLSVGVTAKPGQGEYGIRVSIRTADLNDTGAATVSVVSDNTIIVTLNNRAGFESKVSDFIAAINGTPAASNLVTASLVSGSGATVIGAPATPYAPIVVPPSGGVVTVLNNVLTYVPPLHYNNNIGGPALLLVTIEDDLTAGPVASDPFGAPARLTSTATLTISLAAVNDRPEYDAWPTNKIVDTVELPNGSTTDTRITNFITGIRPGPSQAIDEATGSTLLSLGTPPTGPENQTVDFKNALGVSLVRALTPASFAVQPRIEVVGDTGTLVYRLAEDVNQNVIAGAPQFGPILVEVIAQDSGAVGGINNELNTSVVRTFTILPKPVNDAPEFTIPATAASLEDQGLVTIPAFLKNLREGPVTAEDEAVLQSFLQTEYIYDASAFTVPPSIDLLTGNLTYQTAPHVNSFTGQSLTVSVTVIDNGGVDPILGGQDRTTKSFMIVVQEFNDAPNFVLAPTVEGILEDPFPTADALTTVPNFIAPASIVPGPAAATDEGPSRENQSVRFIVTARNPLLFDGLAGQPKIEGTVDPVTGAPNPNAGQLTYRLRKDINLDTAFQAIIVDVVAVDSGLPSPTSIVQFDPLNTTPRNVNAQATRSFTILPIAVNDAPEFSFVTEPNMVVTSLEDAGFVTRPLINPATIFTGPALATDERLSQTFNAPGGVTFIADASIFDGPAGYPTLNLATGAVTYKTAPNLNRLTPGKNFTVSVTLKDDGGTLNGGIDSLTKSFNIDIVELNDAPEYVMPTSTSAFQEDLNAEPGVTTVPNFVTGIQPGPSTAVDEVGQTVRFQVDAINAAGVVDNSLFDPAGLPRITVVGTTGTLTYRLRQDINQMIPFPRVLVRVIAIDDGVPNPLIEQFDPLNTTLRNINAAASRTFSILPDPINDAPTFTINPSKIDATKPTYPTVNAVEDSVGTSTVTDFLINVLPGPASALDELASQQIRTPIEVEAVNPLAFSQAPALVLVNDTSVPGQNRYRANLTFKTAADVNDNTGQSLLVRFRLQDTGGTVNAGDIDITDWLTISISVAPVNDVPSFTLPIVSPALTPSVRVNEDNGVTSLPFATSIVAGPATALDETTILPWKQALFFDVLSNTNTSLFSVQPSIDPLTGNLNFRSAPERNGQAVVVVQLRDQTNDGTPALSSVPQTFTINITAINDAPEFTPGATYVDAAGNWISNSIEDQGLVVRPNFATNLRVGPVLATDEVNEPQQLTVYVRALDPSAFTATGQPAIDASGTLTYQTARDVNLAQASHDLRVEIYLTDNGTASPLPHNNTSVFRTFTIAAAPINDAPVFTLPSNQVEVKEDNEEFTGVTRTAITNFATRIGQAAGLLSSPPTATDELAQSLQFEVLSVSAPELFSQSADPLLDGQPKISAITGQLTFHTAPHKNGKAVVVVRLVDSGATSPAPNSNTSLSQTFTITITAVNDAPQFDIPGSITVLEDAGLLSQNSFATNVRRGPVGSEDENSQEIRFVVTPLDASAFAVLPQIGVDGTLTFQTALHANKENADLRVRVQLFDNGANSTDPLTDPNTNASIIKTFVINVTPVNDSPIPDGFFRDSDEDVRITILASDVLQGDLAGPTPDENNGSQTLKMTQIERTSRGGGTIIPTFDANNNIVAFDYMPPLNLVGPDTFLYVVTDNGVPARSGTGTITIGLKGVNDPPQFIRGSDQIVPEDTSLVSLPNWATEILPGPPGAADELATQSVTFTVTSNNQPLFEVQPTVSSTGTLQFKPMPDANGVAVVTVIAVDNGVTVAQSQPQVFTITITPVNDAPVFTAGSVVTVDEDSGPYSRNWATGIFAAAGLAQTPQTALDEKDQAVDFTAVADKPSLFSVQPTISSTGLLQFTPNRDATGTALVTVRAVDRGPFGGPDQNTSAAVILTITIIGVNDAPVAVADTYNTTENAILSISAPGILANDGDADLPSEQISVVPAILKSALGADVTVNSDGSFDYDPLLVNAIQQLTTGQNVQDTFVYKIKDQSGVESIAATVTVNVAGVNDAPTAVNDSYTIGVGQSQFLDVLANDFDVDSSIDAASIKITSLPAFGTVVVNQTGVVQYTPSGGFRGVDTFRYTVRDTSGNVSNEAVVTVTVNNRPAANNDVGFSYKNESVDINVLANDSDSDGSLDASSVEIVLVPSPSGTATVLADGSIRFTPATNFVGLATLSYVVKDNTGSVSNVAEVIIRVQRSKWQNPRMPLDVNADTFISPLDALLIINKLNDPTFERNLPLSNFVAPPYLDTSGDELVSPLDALLVINYLNATRLGGGGEGEANLSATTYAMMVTPQQMISTVGTQVVQKVQAALAETLSGIAADAAVGSQTSSNWESSWGWTGIQDDDDGVDALFCSSDEDHESLVMAVDDYFDSIGPYMPE